MKKSLFFMGIMLVLLIVSCDMTPKPVTDTTGVLTVEPTEQGNKLSIAISEDAKVVYIARNDVKAHFYQSYIEIFPTGTTIKAGKYDFLDEFVQADQTYIYSVQIFTQNTTFIESSEVSLKGIGGKGNLAIVNTPALSYDPARNTFSLSEKLIFSETSDIYSTDTIRLIFLKDSSMYSRVAYIDKTKFDSPVDSSFSGSTISVEWIHGILSKNEGDFSIRYFTSNVLTKEQMKFTSTYIAP